MAATTAFQSGAFQNNAFQVVVSSEIAFRNSYVADNSKIVTGVSVNAGDLIVVNLYENGLDSVAGSGCTDNSAGGSNTYRLVGSGYQDSATGGCAHWCYYTVAKATETLTITGTFTTVEWDMIWASVYSGSFDAATCLVQYQTREQAATTTPTGASLTTTVPNLLLHNFWSSTIYTPATLTENGQGFTLRNNIYGACPSYQIVSATGTYNDAITSSVSALFSGTIAAFQQKLSYDATRMFIVFY